MYVNYSDHKNDGLRNLGITHKVIRRRLQCDDCERKLTTYEIQAQDLRRIKDALKDIRRRARLSATALGKFETALKNCKKDLQQINGNQSRA